MARNLLLKGLTWFCGLTSLTIAYGLIKWQKMVYYEDWIFENLNLNYSSHISYLFKHYYQIGGVSILWCILFAFLIDYFVIKKIIIKC